MEKVFSLIGQANQKIGLAIYDPGSCLLSLNDSSIPVHRDRHKQFILQLKQSHIFKSIEIFSDPIFTELSSQNAWTSVLKPESNFISQNDELNNEISSENYCFNSILNLYQDPNKYKVIFDFIREIDLHILLHFRSGGINFSLPVLRDMSLIYKTCSAEDINKNSELEDAFRAGMMMSIIFYMSVAKLPKLPEYCLTFNNYFPSLILEQIYKSYQLKFRTVSWPAYKIFTEKREKNLYTIYKSMSDVDNMPASFCMLKQLSPSREAQKGIYKFMHERICKGGSHVYSPKIELNQFRKMKRSAKNLVRRLIQQKINQEKPIDKAISISHTQPIFTFFTSSEDENQAMKIYRSIFNIKPIKTWEDPMFSSQAEWLDHSLTYLKTLNHPITIFVRIHPRLGNDHRGGRRSPELVSLLKLLNQHQDDGRLDLHVIEPESNISSYLLGAHSDLIINGWSTIGLEMALLGKTVINAFHSCDIGGAAYWPKSNALCFPSSKEEYFKQIANSTKPNNMHKQINTIDDAFKAIGLYSYYGVVDIMQATLFKQQILEPTKITPSLLELLFTSKAKNWNLDKSLRKLATKLQRLPLNI